MDSQEAKFILQAYRPDGRDAANPVFQQALAQAKSDPSLAAWLADEQAFDTAISRKLRSVPTPHTLKPAILAGLHLSQQVRWWSQPSLWAVATSLVLLLGSIVVLKTHQGPSMTLGEFRSHATDYVSQIELQHRSVDVNELQGWLKQQNSPSGKILPAALSKAQSIGCRTLTWNGSKVALICFQSEPELHLFIVRTSDLRNAPDGTIPLFAKTGNITTASWTKGDETFVLTSTGSETDLEKFL